MAIDRIDGTAVTLEYATDDLVNPVAAQRQRYVVLGVAAGVTRTAVMVALASVAILVLLPAAIAAQAASAF